MPRPPPREPPVTPGSLYKHTHARWPCFGSSVVKRNHCFKMSSCLLPPLGVPRCLAALQLSLGLRAALCRCPSSSSSAVRSVYLVLSLLFHITCPSSRPLRTRCSRQPRCALKGHGGIIRFGFTERRQAVSMKPRFCHTLFLSDAK